MSWFTKLFSSKVNNREDILNRPEIPEEIFIEKTVPENNGTEIKKVTSQDNIHVVYEFLSKDYQQQGYDDALIHPDNSYKVEKIREIQGDLDIVIRKSKTFYEDAIRELDFLITSRNRLGMVDLVDELKMKKEKAEDHYKKVIEIQQEAIEQGESHRLIISYNRGFQNGMATIAIHEANKRNF